jgi:hypothetical protein
MDMKAPLSNQPSDKVRANEAFFSSISLLNTP